jgi:hypothetical protein
MRPTERVAGAAAGGYSLLAVKVKSVFYVFGMSKNALRLLMVQHTHMPLLKGEDITQSCKQLDVRACGPKAYRFVASYPPAQQYLYALTPD